MFEETGLVVDPAALTAARSTAAPASSAGTACTTAATTPSSRCRWPRDVEVSFDHLEPEEVGIVLACGLVDARRRWRPTAAPSPTDLPGHHGAGRRRRCWSR